MKTLATLLGVLLTALFVILIYACLGGSPTNWYDLAIQCEDAIVEEVLSPDQTWIATTYIRNCGATAPYATHVNLRRKGVKFDGKKQEPIFVMGRKQKLEMKWLGQDTLLVKYPEPLGEKDGVFRHDELHDGVKIIYESVPRTHAPNN
jgi:hypothetical protein